MIILKTDISIEFVPLIPSEMTLVSSDFASLYPLNSHRCGTFCLTTFFLIHFLP
jgi:hypothetical protein